MTDEGSKSNPSIGAKPLGPSRMVGTMTDDATAKFLSAAARDLQRQLGIAGSVEDLSLEKDSGRVALVAAIRVAGDDVIVRGIGVDLLAAYADLRQSVPQPVLGSAFAQVIDLHR